MIYIKVTGPAILTISKKIMIKKIIIAILLTFTNHQLKTQSLLMTFTGTSYIFLPRIYSLRIRINLLPGCAVYSE